MLSDEERELIEEIQKGNKIGIYELIRTFKREGIENFITVRRKYIDIMINLIEKQTKEIEELKETLKCTQNSWFEDTQKIEEMKKQLDLDNECEIALNSKIMDLEKEIEELKENNKTLKNLQNDTNRLYIEMIERKNYFERELQKVVDKIKAKIEELDEEIKVKKEIARKPMDRVSGRLLSDNIVELEKTKKVLQSLLEKE